MYIRNWLPKKLGGVINDKILRQTLLLHTGVERVLPRRQTSRNLVLRFPEEKGGSARDPANHGNVLGKEKPERVRKILGINR